MQFRYSLPIPAILALAASAPALAQYRCDCTSVVDSCEADIAVRPNWIEITTDRQQCARVDYFLDGQPFVSVVVDGEHRQDFIPRAEPPRVLVQSCQVCRDTGAAAASNASAAAQPAAQRDGAGGGSDADGGLQALIEVPPAYPEGAAARRVEGYVDVDVTVGPDGSVQDAAVKAAEPQNVFDQAALAAVRRWRYPAEQGREPMTVTERVEFRAGSVAASVNGGVAAEPVARRANGARNECVRQGSVFNYGEMIEVGLLNACDAPLVVFGCAAGTGQYRGHWVCTTSEQQQNVLVQSGDERIGTTTAMTLENDDGSLVPLAYTDRFFMSRAPNAEYWWLACAMDDTACRSAGRQWARSMDKQLAGVDPQGRSSLTVARSY